MAPQHTPTEQGKRALRDLIEAGKYAVSGAQIIRIEKRWNTATNLIFTECSEWVPPEAVTAAAAGGVPTDEPCKNCATALRRRNYDEKQRAALESDPDRPRGLVATKRVHGDVVARCHAIRRDGHQCNVASADGEWYCRAHLKVKETP